MTDLVIIADDLTGAGDSAASLVDRASVSVVLEHSSCWPTTTVLAVDTDSRHSPPQEAANRVASVALRAHKLGATVFKKIDSTLRGNVAVEIRAAAEALAQAGANPLIVVAAAYPEVGRTTVAGLVHVDGQRLERGTHRGDICAMLAEVGYSTRIIPRGPTGAVAEAMEAAHRDKVTAVVIDATVDRDLVSVAEAAKAFPGQTLLVGSGGLVRPLRDRWQAHTKSPPVSAPIGPVLFVVGSYAKQALAQIAGLVAAGVPHVWVRPTSLTDDLVTAVRQGLASGDVLLAPDPTLPVNRDQAPAMAHLLATVVYSARQYAPTLVATGGETARAIVGLLGVSQMAVKGELEPGVVLYEIPTLGMDLITKAGAFGDRETLLGYRTNAKQRRTTSCPDPS